MAKKRTSGRSSPNASPVKSEGDAQAQLTALRDEGNKLFGKKEYAKALESYDKALKSIQANHPDKPLLHSNKAACHMMGKKYKEAINECTAALEAQPGYHKALTRRAKAYEQMGHYKQALSDVQKANKTADATPETLEAEKRLKDIMAGKRPSSSTLATSNGTAAAKKQATRQQRSAPYVFQAKIQLDDDVRAMHMTGQATYAELQHAVREKFPDAGPLVLKYLDREGDLVTITDRQDLQMALKEVVDHAERLQSQHGGPRLPNIMPPLRLQAFRTARESDVPQPPAEELNNFQQMQMARKFIAEQAAKQQNQQQKKDEQQEVPQEQYAMDQWIVEFANLFRDHTGVDPDKHLDLQQLGWDKCTTAMEDAIGSEKAEAIFQQAADKFQEVAATGMLQWGNVFLSLARKYLDEAAAKGTIPEVTDKVQAQFDKATAKYREALSIKTDFYDGEMQLGQVDFERAKLAAGFTPVPAKVSPTDEEGVARPTEVMQELLQAAHQASNRKALDDIKKENVEKSKPLFEAAVQHYEDAIKLLPEEERKKPIKQQVAGDPPAAEEDINFYAQSLVLIGNLLYEQSQLVAAVGQDGWKEQVDKAAKLFRQAGCVESDIRNALVSHLKHEELDIPAEEPKQVTETTDSTASEKETKEQEPVKESVKGLPSLKPKPKAGKKGEKEADAATSQLTDAVTE